MVDDFEDRQKDEILKNIENPHQKDLANFVITSKDIAFQSATIGLAAACFSYCSYLFSEAGDHLASLVCYGACSAISGYSTYTNFRKLWQCYSIPAKNYIVRFSYHLKNLFRK